LLVAGWMDFFVEKIDLLDLKPHQKFVIDRKKIFGRTKKCGKNLC
jgi:hypothetical protein